ncbi:effector-associated constant component EACC1 [Streptomyces cyanogenus]|uniref:Uncharacterized protein n=1 Tax=Streptomyces cyanogenus TaxID=80860 RepID=A0ABX7U466_STRCY|nr:hypothetical protein [Streptomyces cyanogenus]QTE02969.1 hypothetical protein S1361_36885 [Streptomyces cyanogenus]
MEEYEGSETPPAPGSLPVLVAGEPGGEATWLVQRRADVTVGPDRNGGRKFTVEVRRRSDPQAVSRAVGRLLEGGEE